ncbi:MAG: acyltransferase [Opitutales bacterium]|nr:acyltransferase [Opitutales bacterium]
MYNKNPLARQSNFELLRLLAIFSIIISHVAFLGCDIPSIDYMMPSAGALFAKLCTLGGEFGVDCFILISGYFLCGQQFKLSRLVNLFVFVFLYSVSLLLVYIAIVKGFNLPLTFSGKDILECVFPISMWTYWFITAYAILYVLSPLLNAVIDNIDEKVYKTILVVGFLYVCIRPMLFVSYTSAIATFVFLYLLGAFVKKHKIKMLEKRPLCINICTLFCAVSFTLLAICLAVVFGQRLLLKAASYPMANYSFFMVVLSLSMFAVFSRLQISSYSVNYVAKSVFAVYIIHEHPLLKEIIWQYIFPLKDYIASKWFLFEFVFACVALFIACFAADLLRRKVAEILRINVLYSKLIQKITHVIEAFFGFLTSKI